MTENKPTIVFISTYPPRECGIATFTQDLLYFSQKFLGSSVQCKVAAMNLTPLDTYTYPPEVEWKIDQNSKKDFLKLAKTVNNDNDITGVILQHEYGIFGGVDGENILTFMSACKKPILVTLHTVLPEPSPKMKEVTANIIKHAYSVVVLTQKSKEIVEAMYPDTFGKLSVIPHGIHPSTFSTQKKYKEKLELENHTILSTFGLLSQGKGIEYVIHALPDVIKKYPDIMYLILGETHPVVRRNEGERYRNKLYRLITKMGLKKHVKFYDQYLSLSELLAFLKATDIYISTSINPNQAVSGTLSYALGSGRAVISTEFAQAKEIVTPDIGRLVPIQNSSAISAAILNLLSNNKKLKQMHRQAFKATRVMLWSNVAKNYLELLEGTIVPLIKIDHLKDMTDTFGLFQFASLTKPNKDSGYTLDDNARALIVCNWMIRQKYTKELENLIVIYLKFMSKCQLEDGSFINYIGFDDKLPTSQNTKEDLDDNNGRALWALSEVISNNVLSPEIRKQAKKMFLLTLKRGQTLHHLRSKAFAIKAFSLAQQVLPEYRDELLNNIKHYSNDLIKALKTNSYKSWSWFEDSLNYNNALLSESLLLAGETTKNKEYINKGVSSLEFLIGKTFSSNMYIPIGHSQWYKKNKTRSRYDQQPEDPASMILALITAYKITSKEEYKNLAKKCFSWFLGNNSLHKPLYNEKTGGCYDGLHPDRANLNEGGESLVAYLMSNFRIKELN